MKTMESSVTPGFLIVSPIGRVSPVLADHVACRVETFFGLSARIQPLVESIEFAYDQDRRQYHSTPILEALAEKAPDDCAKILAITLEDLFIPILTHVYGEAQLDGDACIVSTRRLDADMPSDPAVIYGRIVKEAIHELGHTFNLRHCREASCLMHYCRSLEDVDAKSRHFCRYCQVMLTDEINRLSR